MVEYLYRDEELAAEYSQEQFEDFSEAWMSGMQMPWVQQMYGWQGAMDGSQGWRPQSYGQGHKMRAQAPHGQPQKQRFCATFPHISRCRHGSNCAFAHSREEVSAPLLTPEEEVAAPEALTVEFFTQKFKVFWCPVGAQHDWQACMYAHTYQDVRRPPSLGYGHQLCPYWNKKDTNLAYAQRCPLGPRCPYAHGAKEQLYHPNYFRTLVCRDLQRRRCPRAHLCAFFHRQNDCRKVKTDPVSYEEPLSKEVMSEEWLQHFLNPPRFQEAMDGAEAYTDPYMAALSSPMLPMDPMLYPKVFEEHRSEDTESTAEEDGQNEDLETASSQGAARSLLRGYDSLLADDDSWAQFASGQMPHEASWDASAVNRDQSYGKAFGGYPGLFMPTEAMGHLQPTSLDGTDAKFRSSF